MKIGVLAVQGDIREHANMIEKIGHTPVRVKSIETLNDVAGLIIPGGESTTISKLMKKTGLWEELKRKAQEGFPIFGTCAGMIVVSKGIANYPQQETMGLIDIYVERNAYGRQVFSFEEILSFQGKDIKVTFIRAPKIVKYGENIERLIEFKDAPVLVRQDNILVASFHPEIEDDPSVHQYFIEQMVAKKQVK
ncbi:pyridoxal phosphate synthase yaaE subunit [Marinitoga hydrogenitolerans DSM 16785]|uniref:Pyridoxal 5'-phosphate synthase subunit PdxT n=1 Tax=Marinitoga hydrogenitolerans (strain DSM 16785 / JCM 12826 / AT1271) TaxID=1122195 RepID=A0A1M4UMA7_MARH1|nr:pyridoxal 5'-phosphate synthase glutaminase subunit PdxT [Marinitoga hydrogenitolerans]SHE57859.1 pyridoxal phosphate synthase yaaE subunit [Marinitoga hydrogenitolerans DSM 16785]